MTDEKVYTPAVIDDNPFPNGELVDLGTTQSTSNQTYGAQKITDQSFPTKRIAVELIGTALNTQSRKILAEFEFTKSGALQIGLYESGVSGDVKISPNGIVARDSSGITTFTLDGDTGSATFKGTVQAGTLISGAVAVGDGDILIDGETKRMIFYDENGIPVIIIGNA
jgi:hypothetical protein